MQRMARLLDSHFGIPGTRFRFGLDSLLGLLPGVGDSATAVMALWLVFEGWRMGVGKPTLARMTRNVLIDLVVGSIPVAGDAFDLVWKANRRNLELIEADLAAQRRDRPHNAG